MVTPPDLLLAALAPPQFRRATFAGAVRRPRPDAPWLRVQLRPLTLRGQPHVQFSAFDGRKTHVTNHPADALAGPLDELLALGFASVHVRTDSEELELRTSRKGKQHLARRKVADAGPDPAAVHNRLKDVPLPEGRPSRLLQVMGIQTPGGDIKPKMRAKFGQINEFLKHLAHALPDAGLEGLGRPVELLDCGCGASYLTLAAQHYLNDVLGIPAVVRGIDVNDEVIRKSVERAERAGASGRAAFACGPIGAAGGPADIVVALHACDTATDDALAHAVRGGAKLILAAPCCHRHLNAQVKATGDAELFRPLLRHGILRERQADLLTDALRAHLLRLHGYRAEVVEFVSAEHTARNLLIRAVRTGAPADTGLAEEYRRLRDFWGVRVRLEELLDAEPA